MFDTTVVKMKAGHVGQVVLNGKVLWESETFLTEMVPCDDNKLRRTYETDLSYDKALNAAGKKILDVLEGLFA